MRVTRFQISGEVGTTLRRPCRTSSQSAKNLSALISASASSSAVPIPMISCMWVGKSFWIASSSRSPVPAERAVTLSPDVATSTHLAGWINKVGVFAPEASADYEEGAQRMLRWLPGPEGRHIELGISEMNLFMALGQFGLSYELTGPVYGRSVCCPSSSTLSPVAVSATTRRPSVTSA